MQIRPPCLLDSMPKKAVAIPMSLCLALLHIGGLCIINITGD